MPPKKSAKPDTDDETEDLAGLIKEVLSSQKRMEKNQTNMQDQLNSLLDGFKKMKTGLSEAEHNIENLLMKTNMIEQHSRNFTVRVFNMNLSTETASDCVKTSKQIYNELFRPILELAVESGELDRVPELLGTIEYSHILPAKGTSVNPVIVRLQSRILRSLLFKYKARYYKSHPEVKSSIYEDLTVANYKLLKSRQDDPTVLRAWTSSGRVKFVLKSNPDCVLSADPPYSPTPLSRVSSPSS